MSNKWIEPAMDAMEKYTGVEKGYRRAHPRGLVCGGTFQATGEARQLSKAEHLQGAVIPVQVRLSNASGSPWAPDRISPRKGKVLGLALRFRLPSGGLASWAAANLPSFLARTPEDFVRITRAQKKWLFGKPNPFKLISYICSRPSALSGIKAAATLPAVASFAEVRFNGMHTYYLEADGGRRQAFRYSWQPIEKAFEAPGEKQCGQYLLNELKQRLKAGPLQWNLVFHFPSADDPLDDATRAWPDSRPSIVAGTLTVDHVEPDQLELESLVFDPTGVVPGIELSSDPLLRFRSEVYRVSHNRRTHEVRAVPGPPDMTDIGL